MLWTVDGMIIRNNLIWDTSQNIYLSGENPNAPIRNVQVLGNVVWNQNNPDGGKGLSIGGNLSPITNLRIEGNTFGYNAMNIISDSYAQDTSAYISGLTIRNNIFYKTRLALEVVSDFPCDYNLFFNPGEEILIWSGAFWTLSSFRAAHPATNVHSIQADPLFGNPSVYDFHLQATSPAINKGTTIGGLTMDPDGNPRPQGAAYDMGAYELPWNGDINRDGYVNMADRLILDGSWDGCSGDASYDSACDLNRDGLRQRGRPVGAGWQLDRRTLSDRRSQPRWPRQHGGPGDPGRQLGRV